MMMQDVEATVLREAQANLVTAAAQRVLEACKQAGKEPPEQVRPSRCLSIPVLKILTSKRSASLHQLSTIL